MKPDRSGMTYDFGSRLTRLGQRMLLFYGIIYVLELIFEHWVGIPIYSYLCLFPFQDKHFFIWQLITHPFLHDPNSPLSFIMTCIVFYFFAGPVEEAFGIKRFLILFYISALGGLVFGLAFGSIAGLNTPFSGMLPSLLTLIVVFGLISPEATILLMFVLPLKAKYLSYGTIIITVLTFLSKVNPSGAFHLGGILLGYLYFRGWSPQDSIHWVRRKWLERQLKRKRSRFIVIEGNKKGNEREKPTIH